MIKKLFLNFWIISALTISLGWTHEEHKNGHEKAEETPQKSVSIEGEILDLSCYMAHGAKGKKHRACAKSCLLEGNPAGLLTEDGKVFLLLEDHSHKKYKKPMKKLKKLAALSVEVTGQPIEKGGIHSILVHSVRKQ